jgi:hypothetical protein
VTGLGKLFLSGDCHPNNEFYIESPKLEVLVVQDTLEEELSTHWQIEQLFHQSEKMRPNDDERKQRTLEMRPEMQIRGGK